MNARKEKLLSRIRLAEQVGLEIGALDKPSIHRTEGNVRYVDYAPTEELRKSHSRTPTVNTERIVSVDYVWGENSLSQATGKTSAFDYVVASHVLEHVPDLATWLREVAEVLRPDGILSLVVPDKRYTFDRLRRTTDLPDVIESYLERRRRPGLKQIFDNYCYHTRVDASAAWEGRVREADLSTVHDDRYALEVCRDAQATGRYVDGHCWVFTADSFLDLFARLAEIGLLPFELVTYFPPAHGEIDFFVSLRRAAESDDRSEWKRRAATFRQVRAGPEDTQPALEGARKALPPLPNALELVRPLVARAKTVLEAHPTIRGIAEGAWIFVNDVARRGGRGPLA